MNANPRIEVFLGKAGLRPPEPISKLHKPRGSASRGLLLNIDDQDAARSLLVKQRTSDPKYRPPCQQKRHRFRTQKQKDAVSKEENWVFTKHEVARVFDSLISRTSLVSAGVARALLAHVPSTSVQGLWRHLQDPGLQKWQRRGIAGTKSFKSSEFTWLDKVTHHGDLDYINLLCQSRLRQNILDRAFGIALRMRSMDSMELLLSFGAVATAYRDTIREHVRIRNIALVRLLLSAPRSTDAEFWRHCIEPDIMSPQPPGKDFVNILMCCCAYRRDINSSTLFLNALGSQNFEATAIILAYAGSYGGFSERGSACELVTQIQNHERRLAFFDLLAEAGIIADNLILQAELARDVEDGHFGLVKLLVSAGVALDPPPHHAFYRAVSRLDYNMLGAFQGGHFTAPVSGALSYIPEGISEPDMIRLMNILGPMGVTGNVLDPSLTQAVYAKHEKLIGTLLRYGASVEFDSAAAIKIAIRNVDLDILSTLLQKDCSPEILSTAILVAMELPSRPNRLRAMKALLDKGVQSQMLGGPLQFLGSEEGEMDAELIRVLVEHQAPLDDAKLVVVAVQRGNMEVLTMLCEARPRNEILAPAVPAAFDAMRSLAYDVVLNMIKLLLQKGASGPLIDETLFQATMRDNSLHIVRALLYEGADANYATGAPYIVAVERKNSKLLEVLCAGCAPNQASMESVFVTAVDPAYYDPEILELILQSASSSGATRGISWDIDRLQDHPNLSEIVRCLLRHDLNVDKWSETLLLFAIRAMDVDLLATILCEGPSNRAMRAAFENVRGVESRTLQLQMMKLLLTTAASHETHEIGQSEALAQETKAALDGDSAGLLLLLRHNAFVDFDEGKALRIASKAGSFEVVDMLLSAGAARWTVIGAFVAASSADMKQDKRHGIFCRLLNANSQIPDVWISKALFNAVSTHPLSSELPQLLVAHGAKADFKLLQVALHLCSKDVFEIIVSSIADTCITTKAFKQARGMKMNPSRRYWAYSALLEKGVEGNEVSEALIKSLEDDPHNWDIPKLLLGHDAVVGHRHAVSFEIALNTKNLQGFRLLCQYIIDDDTANLAFQSVRMNKTLDQDELHEAYSSCLLQWPIAQSQLHAALVDSIKQPPGARNKIMRLLLQTGADPNHDNAHCFILACNPSHVEVFRALCRYADPEVVLPRLLDHVQHAKKAAFWIGECLNETPGWTKKIDHAGLLLQCMRKFPENTELLEFLLYRGVLASAKAETSLGEGWPVESCTALLWAMFAHPRIDNRVIERLLAQGEEVCMEYSAPQTNVSGIFGCLIDKSRTPLLKYFLEFGDPDILNHTISGFTFMKLVSNSDHQSTEELGALFGEEDEISPREASLFLGNFEAFRLMGGGETPDDGTLHLAALLALPKFVKWLLNAYGHDPNHAAESFGFMVPLGLACSSKSFPWCKIANEEADWSERLKETMRILAPETDTNWRLARKTLLHIALDNGLEVTEAMVEALDISHDLDKVKKYSYEDRAGTTYTPIQYIGSLLAAADGEKWKLVKCLERHGLAESDP